MAHVALDNVHKNYPAARGARAPVPAVKGVTLDIADGELVVLVGPSGCGKSTTLRLIAGLEDADSGCIRIDGRVVNDVHPKDRDIAMVFQNYALYPHMSVRQNMAFALKLRGLARDTIDARVNDAARTLGLEDLLDRTPGQLSGGQRQRVAVGRAIVREPKAFLFDEPLSNLDAKLRVTTRAELKALHHRLRTTTVYVTHDQEEAMTLGDRIVVMARGEIQQVGPPLEVYARPANRFVAGFIGMPPMNFLSGRFETAGASTVFHESAPGAAPTGVVIPVPPGVASRLRTHAGGEVVLGIRPQALSEAGASSNTPGAFAVRVTVVEPLGDTMDVVCATALHPHIVARVPARSGVTPGQELRLAVNTERLHFFVPGEFGKSLLG